MKITMKGILISTWRNNKWRNYRKKWIKWRYSKSWNERQRISIYISQKKTKTNLSATTSTFKKKHLIFKLSKIIITFIFRTIMLMTPLKIIKILMSAIKIKKVMRAERSLSTILTLKLKFRMHYFILISIIRSLLQLLPRLESMVRILMFTMEKTLGLENP